MKIRGRQLLLYIVLRNATHVVKPNLFFHLVPSWDFLGLNFGSRDFIGFFIALFWKP